jgi:hypothetical protein
MDNPSELISMPLHVLDQEQRSPRAQLWSALSALELEVLRNRTRPRVVGLLMGLHLAWLGLAGFFLALAGYWVVQGLRESPLSHAVQSAGLVVLSIFCGMAADFCQERFWSIARIRRALEVFAPKSAGRLREALVLLNTCEAARRYRDAVRGNGRELIYQDVLLMEQMNREHGWSRALERERELQKLGNVEWEVMYEALYPGAAVRRPA